ncbi:MAG: trypsin-like peptidase domain-containing protein [Spirochaetales bacterium]|nr:trypsin-like peptidase domain-containing protein [Spirochaetales bacterium]
MKLYTLRHLFITAGASIAGFILVGILLGFITLPFSPAGVSNAAYAVGYNPINKVQEAAPQNLDNVSQDERENIEVYRKLNEAVVNITSVTYGYNYFLEPVPQQGTGSGSIIDPKGLVLTNNHVVEKAEKLFITLADGSEYEGSVVGTDPENDLAVIKFDPKGKKLTTMSLGTSSNLLVGNKVLAIGNPFGLERTLTTGIVSGTGRPIKINDYHVIREMIQTDASINPGNSGGPLLNKYGEMIGINTMIYSPSGGSVGIGFAVPIDIAKRVIPELIAYGKVNRGWIDITPIQLFPALVEYAKLPVSEGVLVSELNPGSQAARAGIQGGDKTRAVKYRRTTIYLGGDIIIEIDGLKITSLADMFAALEDNKPGEKVTVKVNRNGTVKTLTIPLTERTRTINKI